MNELHLFAGAGGGILGGQLLGHRCVCAVEWDPYAQAVLVARQNDGTFPPFPIWDDVQNFDGRPWRGRVDVVAGGFPCQDISAAGKGAGLDGERSWLWREMARVISEVRPRFAFIENSTNLISNGLDRVLCDLASMGMDAQWMRVSASNAGAPHKRDRVWIMAYAERLQVRQEPRCRAHGRMGRIIQPIPWDRDCSSALRHFRGMDDGLAYGAYRTDTIRNGQVPHSAATAFSILSRGLT